MPVLAENWNQTGPVDVVTFTNCESVDLYVNATKIGTQKSSDFARTGVMQWTNVPWQAGMIRAVGMNGGKAVVTDTIKTVSSPAKLMLRPDRTTLDADGNDVSCIEVDVCDADNNPVITANNPIQFTMTGPGRSVGIASGDWTNDEPFKGTSRKACKGKVLIVIQSTLVPGTIGLTVTSPGLPPATLTLETNRPLTAARR
jgi:beta-galactosidase